jgi:hypothetical protein
MVVSSNTLEINITIYRYDGFWFVSYPTLSLFHPFLSPHEGINNSARVSFVSQSLLIHFSLLSLSIFSLSWKYKGINDEYQNVFCYNCVVQIRISTNITSVLDWNILNLERTVKRKSKIWSILIIYSDKWEKRKYHI